MKALVYQGPYQMPLMDMQEPKPESEQVIIQVKAVGICGSDVHGFRGTTGRRMPPIIMGHEFSGVVSAVGTAVNEWKTGDRVVINPLLTCGVCASCLAGKPNTCQDRHCLGVDMHGAYASFVAVHRSMVHALPDEVTFAQGAMVEPLAVAMHAANITDFSLCEDVVIIGAGTIGLLTLLSVKMKGAGKVIQIDTDPHRLAFAESIGATHVINAAKTDAVQEVRALTGDKGADAVIEAVGISATANQSLYLVKNGGNVTWIGNSQPEIKINMQQIVTRELTLKGSYGFTSEFTTALAAIQQQIIDPMVLVEKEITLAEASNIIDDLARGKAQYIKVMVNI